MLEKMGAFFDHRLDSYDEHQLNCIDSAREFYPYTAACPSGTQLTSLTWGAERGLSWSTISG